MVNAALRNLDLDALIDGALADPETHGLAAMVKPAMRLLSDTERERIRAGLCDLIAAVETQDREALKALCKQLPVLFRGAAYSAGLKAMERYKTP